MEVKVTEITENPLLERKEVRFEAEHKGAPTPPRARVLEKLTSELEVSENLIVIEKLATPTGRQVASGIARVYESEKQLRELEPRNLLKRTEVSKEKIEEIGEEEEPEEEKAEEAPEEEEAEKEEPEVAEEKKEEIEEEPAEAKEQEIEEKEEETAEKEEAEKEIDYQDLVNQNISDIKEKAGEIELDYQKLLKAEKKDKNRKTLVKWIENKIE